MRLEDLQPSAVIRGVHPDGAVTVVSVQWFGSEALELTYKTATGAVANELVYRDDENRLEIVAEGRPWSFDGDGALFRLVSEAQRIRLAHLFVYTLCERKKRAAEARDYNTLVQSWPEIMRLSLRDEFRPQRSLFSNAS